MPQDFFGWLRIIDAAGLFFVAVRLLAAGLFREYSALFALAILETLSSLLSLAVPLNGQLYIWIYVAFAPVRWALWCGIAWGLYQSTLGKYDSLVTAGRWILSGAIAIALIPIALTLRFDFSHVGPRAVFLPAVYLGERTVTAALAVFILALCAFLAWFTVPMRKNCVYLCLGLGLNFAVRSATFSLRNFVGPEIARSLNFVDLGCSSCVSIAWVILLNRAGEHTTSFVGRRPSQAQVESSVRRLSDIAEHLRR